MRTRILAFGLVSVVTLGAAEAAVAQSFEVSTDTTTVLAGVVVDRRQPAEDDGVGIVPTAIGPTSPGVSLPSGSDLDAFDRLPNGDVLFSTDITVPVAGLPSPGVAGPGDVVRVSASGPVIVYSAAAAGLPAGTDVDAVSSESDGDLLLSFDTTVSVGGIVVDDEDVVRIDTPTGTPTLVYDGSAQGVATGLDLDGLYRNLDNGHLLLSFDGSGMLGGVPFDDEDVLDWNPVGGAYAFAYDGSAPPALWLAGADLDAVSSFGVDTDGDGVGNVGDNCPHFANANQLDTGGIGASSGPDGIGDACQCGDVSGNGRVTTADATLITRSLLVPPTATLARPELCNVGGSAACSTADAVIVTRALLVPPTAVVGQVCAPALP